MTIAAALAAFVALVGYIFGLRHKANRERDARVKAEIDRDHARGEADVARAEASVIVATEQRKDEARAVGEAVREEIAAAAGPEPTPAAVIAAADEARRKRAANAKRKIAAKGGRR